LANCYQDVPTCQAKSEFSDRTFVYVCCDVISSKVIYCNVPKCIIVDKPMKFLGVLDLVDWSRCSNKLHW